MAFWSLMLRRMGWLGVAFLSLGLVDSETGAQTPEVPGGGDEAPPPNKTECIEAHQRTQQMQLSHKYLEARVEAQVCVHQSCPGPLVADCERWLSDLEQRVPSVVFDVRLNGQHISTATVTADGQAVTEWTRGEALRLNPGEHTFRFNLPPYPPVTKTLILTEGTRFHAVSANFNAPPSLPPPTSTPPPRREPEPKERPVPTIVYPLLAAAGVGLGLFAGFAVAGKIEQGELERSCAPNCSDSDLSTMRQRFLVGDIALGVSAAALLGAGVFYLTRPETSSRVTLAPVSGGGVLRIGRTF